jgi:hypothetical protein
MAGPCTFTGNPSVFWAFNSANDAASLTLGTQATWSSNQLQIPRGTAANFERWLINSGAGAILSTSAGGPFTTNWGYISSVSSPGDGTALWLNVTWVNGTKPTSGTLWL